MMLVGPSLVFLFERRFPQRGMSRAILFSVLVTNLALAGWVVGWSALVGWPTYLLIQGTTLRGGRSDRRVDALHPAPVRGDLLPGG